MMVSGSAGRSRPRPMARLTAVAVDGSLAAIDTVTPLMVSSDRPAALRSSVGCRMMQRDERVALDGFDLEHLDPPQIL